jgi:hypothetical protein
VQEEQESRVARQTPTHALTENGEQELAAPRHQPHAFTLRERLAAIRRGARDGGMR